MLIKYVLKIKVLEKKKGGGGFKLLQSGSTFIFHYGKSLGDQDQSM